MNWISWFGLGIVLLLLIPNAVYAAANKNTQPPRTSRILGLAEQAGRYGCMFLMIFHAGLTEFGFASAEGFIAWLAGTGALLVLYWVFWLLYFRAAKPRHYAAAGCATLPDLFAERPFSAPLAAGFLFRVVCCRAHRHYLAKHPRAIGGRPLHNKAKRPGVHSARPAAFCIMPYIRCMRGAWRN